MIAVVAVMAVDIAITAWVARTVITARIAQNVTTVTLAQVVSIARIARIAQNVSIVIIVKSAITAVRPIVKIAVTRIICTATKRVSKTFRKSL
jgi:hypothetical protein